MILWSLKKLFTLTSTTKLLIDYSLKYTCNELCQTSALTRHNPYMNS